MVAFIKNFFAKRRFLKTIHDFEKAMEAMPVLATNLKVSIPQAKKTLKTVMSRAEYKQQLQELQKATRSSIDEMTNALTSAKDFLATHPTAFNAKDKAMYDKKIQSFEAFKVKYEYELHTIFAATPSPVTSPGMRNFTRIIRGIDEAMIALPAKIAYFKKAAPQMKDELSKMVNREVYKRKLQDVQYTATLNISELKQEIVIARNFIASTPKAFNAKEKVMYENKFVKFGAILENYESEIRRIFAATPSKKSRE